MTQVICSVENYLPLEKAAEFEGVPYEALRKRYSRKHIVSVSDPADARRKLVDRHRMEVVVCPAEYRAHRDGRRAAGGIVAGRAAAHQSLADDWAVDRQHTDQCVRYFSLCVARSSILEPAGPRCCATKASISRTKPCQFQSAMVSPPSTK